MCQWYNGTTMSLLRKKKWWQQTLFANIVSTVLVLLCLLLAFSVYDRYQIERDMESRRVQTENELMELQARKEALEEKVEYLRQDRGVEAEMRKHFDVAREGEQVVVLIDKGRPENSVATTTAEEESKTWSFWSWLFP